MSSVIIAGDTSGSVTLAAPAVSGTTTLTLPATSGTIVTSANISSNLPAGSVLQVVTVNKTDTFSTASVTPTFVDITGFTLAITPSSNTSKILVQMVAAVSSAEFVYLRLMRDSTSLLIGDAASTRPRITAGQSYSGANSTYNVESTSVLYLDSPATTSTINYKLQMCCSNGAQPGYLNTADSNRDLTLYDSRQASSIVLMEIKG